MLLLKARETAMAYFRPSLQEHGLTEQQWRVLRALQEFGELSAAGLAKECVILAPSITRILKKLAAAELVEVARSRVDGRELQVRLAERGSAVIDKIAPISEAQYGLIRDRLHPDRLQELYRLLHEFVELDDHPSRGDSQ